MRAAQRAADPSDSYDAGGARETRYGGGVQHLLNARDRKFNAVHQAQLALDAACPKVQRTASERTSSHSGWNNFCRGERFGRLLNPTKPDSPCSLKRRIHKRSVGREMPQRQQVRPAFRVAAYMRTHFNR